MTRRPHKPGIQMPFFPVWLEAKGVELIWPLTDHPFGHRTIFFRDPDGNVLEIFAEI